MRKSILFLAALAVLTAFAGCNSTGTGGVKTGNGATISVQAVSTLTPPATVAVASAMSVASTGVEPKDDQEGQDEDGTLIATSRIYANIEFIEMELPDGADCDSFGGYEFAPPVSCNSNKILIDGPYIVDLELGTTIPGTGDLTIPPGLYNRVKLRFGPSDGVNLPETHPLIGHSFYAEGGYWLPTDTPPPVPATRHFTLALDFNVEPEFENLAGIAITADALDKVLLTLDVAGWFANLHIGNCVEDLVTIPEPLDLSSDLTGDCEVKNIFKDNVENSGDLEEEGD